MAASRISERLALAVIRQVRRSFAAQRLVDHTRMAWIRAEVQLSNTDCHTLRVILEPLFVQHQYMNLDTFSMADVADMIETLCIKSKYLPILLYGTDA